MPLLNKLIALFFTLSLFLTAAFVHSETLQPFTNHNQQIAKIKQALFSLLGKQTKVTVEPYNNDFYLVITDDQRFFSSPDGKYLYLGQVIDTQNKLNITEEAYKNQRVTLLAALPREALLSYKAKNQKHIVTIFTDIDCPFCRKLHQHIKELNQQGITVDYVMIPRGGKGSKAFSKTAAALCAKNPQFAMNSAMYSGKYKGDVSESCNQQLQAQQNIAAQFGFTATPTILLENGEAISGLISPSDLVVRLKAVQKG